MIEPMRKRLRHAIRVTRQMLMPISLMGIQLCRRIVDDEPDITQLIVREMGKGSPRPPDYPVAAQPQQDA